MDASTSEKHQKDGKSNQEDIVTIAHVMYLLKEAMKSNDKVIDRVEAMMLFGSVE